LQDQFASFFEGKGKNLALRRHQFEAYLDKVFDFSTQVEALPDGREFPRHTEKKVFDAVFLGAACQFPALHRIETECKKGALFKRIGPLSEDAIRYTLERNDVGALFALGCQVARQLKRNGVLRSNWSRGLVVAAVDGIEICSSFVRCCEHCMERQVSHRVEGELREQTQYYHRICVVAVVSSAFPIPLGIRFQKNGEDEVACSLALIKDLIERLGSRFFDLLVFDALYLQTPFTAKIQDLGLSWVGTLKENQPELLAEAQRVTSGVPEAHAPGEYERLLLWHVPEVYWAAADRTVRVVKTIRTQQKNHRQIRRDEQGRKRVEKKTVTETSTNFYVSNLELGSIPPFFIHQLGRSRWRIDSEAFQTLATEGQLKRPSVHQDRGQALIALTMIRILAYTLTQVFFHRQVRSHFRKSSFGFCDLARRLADQFLIVAQTNSS
jgi:hypothetical protein